MCVSHPQPAKECRSSCRLRRDENHDTQLTKSIPGIFVGPFEERVGGTKTTTYSTTTALSPDSEAQGMVGYNMRALCSSTKFSPSVNVYLRADAREGRGHARDDVV